jgi:integrase
MTPQNAIPSTTRSFRKATSRRKSNKTYRTREHLTEQEVDKLLTALKRNRHGHRDWLIALMIFRHGLRVSEACDLRWDDLDLPKRQIMVRRRGLRPFAVRERRRASQPFAAPAVQPP